MANANSKERKKNITILLTFSLTVCVCVFFLFHRMILAFFSLLKCYSFLVFVQCSFLVVSVCLASAFFSIFLHLNKLQMTVYFLYDFSLSSNLSRSCYFFVSQTKYDREKKKYQIYNEAVDLDALKCCYHWNCFQWKIPSHQTSGCVCMYVWAWFLARVFVFLRYFDDISFFFCVVTCTRFANVFFRW